MHQNIGNREYDQRYDLRCCLMKLFALTNPINSTRHSEQSIVTKQTRVHTFKHNSKEKQNQVLKLQKKRIKTIFKEQITIALKVGDKGPRC